MVKTAKQTTQTDENGKTESEKRSKANSEMDKTETAKTVKTHILIETVKMPSDQTANSKTPNGKQQVRHGL